MARPDPCSAAVPAPLTASQRKHARALAHHIEPSVRVGQGGVSEGVLGAVRQALLDHELIKVRLQEPEDKKGMARALASGTGAELCGLVGHTVILYKRHPELPKVTL